MKKRIMSVLFAFCFLLAGVFVWTEDLYAQSLGSEQQAKEKALRDVPGAAVTDADRDYEDGTLVYEVELVKGNKKYDIIYRASDGKTLEYGWQKISVRPKRSKSLVKKSKIRKQAKKEVKGGTISSIYRDRDDGIDIYKVKMTKGDKRYSLEYHARTGSLIEYDWEVSGF